VRFKRPRLTFALDEGAPNSVGRALEARAHKVVYLNEGNLVPRGSKDSFVCAFAVLNDAILVAVDGDMKTLAKRHGVSNSMYARLNLVHLKCIETEAASRVASRSLQLT
jgi:predicted nuclease of predicted toxin-antitoxin system